jgi:hypothetical protein
MADYKLDPAGLLSEWIATQPLTAATNKCPRGELKKVLSYLLLWRQPDDVDVILFNCRKEYCGSIVTGESIDYLCAEPELAYLWRRYSTNNTPLTAEELGHLKQGIPFLFCNGIFWDRLPPGLDGSEASVTASLPAILGDDFEELAKKCAARISANTAFVEKLVNCWDKWGWLDSWNGIYCVFRKRGWNDISSTRIIDESVLVHLDVFDHKINVALDMGHESVSQCFLQLT